MENVLTLPEWRNPKHTTDGRINLEISHQRLGWIPFTADPDDVEEVGRAIYDQVVEMGEIADCDPASPEEMQSAIVAEVQQRLDTFAQTKGYDSILSAATYANSAIPQFASEGQQAAALRDATWTRLYEMLAEVQAGTRAVPSGIAEIEAELPALQWL